LYSHFSPDAPGAASPVWRAASGEDASAALAGHLRRLGLPGEACAGELPGSHSLQLPSGDDTISIIIPTHDQAPVLERCVVSVLEKTRYSHFEILLMENNSRESETFETYERLAAMDPRVRLLHWRGEFSFARINNDAAAHSQADFLLFLNNDTEVISSDWIERMLDYGRQPGVGAVGASLYYPDDTVQHAGVIVGIWGIAAHSHKHLERGQPGYNGRAALVQNFSAVTAACMLVRRQTFLELGGFDPAFQVAYNDVDLCLRMREQGYRIVWTPHARLYHHEQLTRGDEMAPKARQRVLRETDLLLHRWARYFSEGDPFYNPNLTLDKEDYSLRTS
jgi:GT2 family glycosyltransferase